MELVLEKICSIDFIFPFVMGVLMTVFFELLVYGLGFGSAKKQVENKTSETGSGFAVFQYDEKGRDK